MKHASEVGIRFGRLVCIAHGPHHVTPSGKTHRTLICRCDCGNEKRGFAASLRAGALKSCGCMPRGIVGHGASERKGLRRTAEYSSWAGMRSRCSDPKLQAYRHYGARGITVCDRWSSFEVFLADMGKCPPGHSIDRIDVNGNYEPANCRWADAHTQANNTRRSVRLVVDGVSRTVAEWARATGLGDKAIRGRLKRGWTPERAVRP
jgi:hypothetical protein